MLMFEDAAQQARVRFGSFEADLVTGELLRDDQAVPLGGKPFEVLALLLRRPGELVDRRELRQALWPAASAADGDKSLNAAVKTLRQAVGDSAEAPRMVETLRGRGYRLMVEVVPVADDPVRRLRDRGRSTARGRLWISALLALLALAPGIVLVVQRSSRPTPSGQPARLAVLPLSATVADESGDCLAEALTEEIITSLGNLAPRQLAVVGRTSLPLLRQPLDATAIASRLDADYLVEGSVVAAAADEPLRCHLRLIDAAEGTQLWADGIDHGASGIVELLAGLEAAVLQQLGGAEGATARSLPSRTDGNAHQLYLRGLAESRTRTWEAVRRSQELFAQAAESDPDFTLAHLMVARHAWQRWLGRRPARDAALQAAEQHLARALELSPDLAAALTLQADIRLRAHRDWVGAESSYQRAVVAAPADSAVRHRRAWFLLAAGRHRAARQEMALALELDPLSADLYSDLGWFHYRAGDFSTALEHCYDALELDSGLAPAAECRFRALAHLGRHDQARQTIMTSLAALDPPQTLLVAAQRADAAEGYRLLFGWLAKQRAEMAGPFIAAMDAASLGELEDALDYLERALAEQDPYLFLVAVTPELKSLSGNPRFESVLAQVRGRGNGAE